MAQHDDDQIRASASDDYKTINSHENDSATANLDIGYQTYSSSILIIFLLNKMAVS